jgi:hypothetical protein
MAALEAGALGAGEGRVGWPGQLGGCEDRFRRWIIKVTIATSGNQSGQQALFFKWFR